MYVVHFVTVTRSLQTCGMPASTSSFMSCFIRNSNWSSCPKETHTRVRTVRAGESQHVDSQKLQLCSSKPKLPFLVEHVYNASVNLACPCMRLAALYSATKSHQNSCTAKLQLFSSILEAKQQLNSSCSRMEKRCAAFEALGSSFAVHLPTFKCCEVAAVMLQCSCGRFEKTTFLSANKINHQKSLATHYSF